MQKDDFKYGDQILHLEAETYHYSGYLEPLNGMFPVKKFRQRFEEITDRVALNIDIHKYFLKLQYDGRDHDRKVRQCLIQLAPVIGDALGQIACTIFNESDSCPQGEYFEYYSISQGKLFRQPAIIVPGDKEEFSGCD